VVGRGGWGPASPHPLVLASQGNHTSFPVMDNYARTVDTSSFIFHTINLGLGGMLLPTDHGAGIVPIYSTLA
jgi:hypothetical protein